jgi:O-antigen/teichoic acid export membrane protein
MTGLIPVAVGCTILADPLVHLVLPQSYDGAGFLLALGIWRAPLLILAYLYQITLIAINRESVGVRTLVAGALAIVPLVALLRLTFGLPGAAFGVLLIGLALVLAGYSCLAREGRQPAWHHHLARPILGSLAMVPVCLMLKHYHVLIAVVGGGVTYVAVWLALGGMRHTQLWGRVLQPARPTS